MRGRQVKKLKKYILNNLTDVLITIRNEVGKKTEDMGATEIYKQIKKGNFK